MRKNCCCRIRYRSDQQWAHMDCQLDGEFAVDYQSLQYTVWSGPAVTATRTLTQGTQCTVSYTVPNYFRRSAYSMYMYTISLLTSSLTSFRYSQGRYKLLEKVAINDANVDTWGRTSRWDCRTKISNTDNIVHFPPRDILPPKWTDTAGKTSTVLTSKFWGKIPKILRQFVSPISH